MGAVPALRTWSSGEIATAAMLNANVRDPVNFLLNRPYLLLSNSGNVSIPASTWTLLSFDTEFVDTDNMHSIFTNPDTITVQTPGLYDIQIAARWAATAVTDTTGRGVQVRLAHRRLSARRRRRDLHLGRAEQRRRQLPDHRRNLGVGVFEHRRRGAVLRLAIHHGRARAHLRHVRGCGQLRHPALDRPTLTLGGAMATIPSPRTWVAGDSPSAAMLNADLRDGFGFLLGPPRAFLYSSIVQAVGVSSTVLLKWDSELIDTDQMHDPANQSRLTLTTPGLYEILLHVKWLAASDTGLRYATIDLNNNGATSSTTSRLGLDTLKLIGETNTPQTNHLRIRWAMNAGDYVEASVTSTSTSVTNAASGTATYLAARWLAA